MVLQEKHAARDQLRFAEEEEEKNFQLIVKETFLEYVPDREADDAASHAESEPAKEVMKINDLRNLGSATDSGTEPSKPIQSIESIGSRLHESGLCKPCAWFWKPTGCRNGTECRHCHSCTLGEFNRRKRERRRLFRQKGSQQQVPYGDESPLSLSPRSPRTEPETDCHERWLSPERGAAGGFQRAVTWPVTSFDTNQGRPFVAAVPVMIIAMPVPVPVVPSVVISRTH
ncbi:unnamed protein product [Cladocopium goreaui]|uniref:C3H1-type domain-containing protein n=1 Tax=Cladocopium goreaui TaxID=2562237 RepID=A0A9P1GSK0_9DINO|nr:unnamed protein product [Cladocopium goreaui]